MQLNAIYTSSWEEGSIHTRAAICTISRTIVECNASDEGENYEHHTGDSVQIEHDGEFYEFECDQGEFTAEGKKGFEELLDKTLLKPRVQTS
jgi:hypothetical protein